MPPLPRPKQARSITLQARTGKIAAETDVLVVGGGPAGIGAALGAADAGAHVVLAERYGFPGGNAAVSLVMPMMSFHTECEDARSTTMNLMPADHGRGEPVIAGAVKLFVDRLVAAGGAIPPSEETGFVVPFDPEIYKQVALDLLDEAGVNMLFHAFASGVTGDGRVDGAVFETKSGPIVIKAQVLVDCTGDGDIAAFSGVPFEIGRGFDDMVQPMTQMFRMVEFDQSAFDAYVKDHPDQWHGVYGLYDLIKEAEAAGDLSLARENILLFGTPHAREVTVNSTRVTGVLGTDVWDLTYAECQSRRQMQQVVAFLRRYVPGFEEAYNVQSGLSVGVRETRRITGEYQLTGEDILTGREFDDVIARGAYPIDIHNPKGKGTVLGRLPCGKAYDIPLRCLLPKKVDHLVVAGRCISGTHEAHASYRVTPIAMATGQAAGVCAALASRSGKPPRDVPPGEVQQELKRQGSDLGQGILLQRRPKKPVGPS